MEFLLKFKLNQHLYVKDPESSDMGKTIVQNAIDLIYELGLEQFTFKKLSVKIHTTEATIYRYFTSKHRLLVYILNWYWSYLEFLTEMLIPADTPACDKLRRLLTIITHCQKNERQLMDYNLDHLHNIVISDSSKSYLVKEVDTINKEMAFNPLKSLCKRISAIILEIRPDYPYARSLASTLLETAHDQQFFSEHLPSLTDNMSHQQHKKYVLNYLTQLAFSAIK
ncbi:TetR/AcrR family transcriptional regulator [Niabella yanshanensis]|uniref:TetR/AcrR family transcriptional regulator n=1 Tax=Niabella yanshanensis TaxID=577386 RepID=A0ABZ0W4Y6_9BACT|nr:TetR/AcrR family transcriptional regulator [Niabella yanshanensis]WQD37075.1 TetR/AcrR family transcriptional regulator [Niabella yanshanensis]